MWNVSFCLLFMLLKELFVCTQSIKFNGMCGMYQAFCLLSMLLKELFVFTQSIKCIGMFGIYHAYWTDPKNLGGTIDLLSSVRTSVRPDGFRSNGSIVFSDFWHQGSFLWFQKTDEAGFLKKKFFLAKNGEKGVKNMHFWAFLGNYTIDFSDFWYVTSLIYYFKYGIGSFARKIFLGPKWRKRCEKYAFSNTSRQPDHRFFWFLVWE